MKKMKLIPAVVIALASSMLFTACEDQDDKIERVSGLEVQDFIYRGMNTYYLFKDQIPDLADNRFSSATDYQNYLRGFNSPEALFAALKAPEPTDRFSIIVNDYDVLNNLFAGNTTTTGVEYSLFYEPGSDTNIYGVVRYIIPNSPAAAQPITRGDIFTGINGQELTVSNYRNLLNATTLTYNLGTFNGTTVTSSAEAVTVSRAAVTENPVFFKTVFVRGNKRIAYLIYNGFTANFDAQLNAAFAELKAQNPTDLILDLRYNSGGSVLTASRLGAMITGQFSGQLFAKYQYNSDIQAQFEATNPDQLRINFPNSIDSAPINSLNLTKVYVITTGSSASASELVINCLKPYIQVRQIGTKTTGKNTGSITLYDSPTFGTQNRNPNHKYAMQPLVIKTINADNFGDYSNGIEPDLNIPEQAQNMGVLGNENEPLLAAALNYIETGNRPANRNISNPRPFSDSKKLIPFATDMYLPTK